MQTYLILPTHCHVKILKINIFQSHKHFIIYTSHFFLKIIGIKYNKFSHTIKLTPCFLKNSQINLLNYFFMQLTTMFLKKIYFQGKGYKIRKIKSFNYIEFFFGFCHFTIINFEEYKLKLRKKWSFLLFYTTSMKLNKRLFNLKTLKFWNIYTWRGLKIKKQIVFKKPKRKATFI